jgi:hypothetical protein
MDIFLLSLHMQQHKDPDQKIKDTKKKTKKTEQNLPSISERDLPPSILWWRPRMSTRESQREREREQ